MGREVGVSALFGSVRAALTSTLRPLGREGRRWRRRDQVSRRSVSGPEGPNRGPHLCPDVNVKCRFRSKGLEKVYSNGDTYL